MLLTFHSVDIFADGLDQLKGVFTGVETFAEKFTGIFKMLGQSFGAPPEGYVYSCDVYNDISNQSVCVAVSEIISFMGGDLPKANGWTVTIIAPGTHHKTDKQPYYFEMFIKKTDAKYSSCMPYLPHDDMLYRHDATVLSGQKDSQNMHYFRAFIGKKLQNGVYVHVPQAESLGYLNNNPAQAKADPGSVTIGTTLSSLTIYNSSATDYYVGFVNQANAKSMTKETCWAYALVQAHSFALLNAAAPVISLASGTVGIFDVATGALVQTYNMPAKIFQTLPHRASMPYTLEIYQDPVVGNALQPVCMEMQGLMSGNYDQPIGQVRDITPVTCVFWYESAAQLAATGYNDLTPGKIWIVSVTSLISDLDPESKPVIIASATPGQALQFNITRPSYGKKMWLYFLYVDTATDSIAQQYISNFFDKFAGKAMLQTYQQQSFNQMNLAKEPVLASVTKKTNVPKALLVQAAQGALTLNGGAVIDSVTGVTGYLLGADIFLSSGVGAGPMYYHLQPSQTNNDKLIVPTATVQNLYISSAGSTTAPAGMPAVTVVS